MESPPTDAPSKVLSQISFVTPDDKFKEEKPYAFRYDVSEQNITNTNMKMEPHPCEIHDMRGSENEFSLEVQGFEVLNVGDPISYDDYWDDTKVQPYFRRLEELLEKRLGAKRVQVFRHGLRKRHPDFPVSTGSKYDYDQPTSVAHVDTTPEELEEYVTRLSSDTDGDPFEGKCYQWINVWKPLKGPLHDWPLCLCDASSVDEAQDLEAADLLYPDLCTENYQVYHRDKYRWYFLSGQTASEALVFLQADNRPGGHPGVPHCSFFNPGVPAGEPPRESIEVRLLACYELAGQGK